MSNSFWQSAKRLPKSIWVLGVVSLFTDISSELIHSLLPLFMVTTLGSSVAMVGMIEGIAEATALIVKIFSGVLSDWWGKRKSLTLWGYGLAAFIKPLFALATTANWVFAARVCDRIAKGIRGAPRDALIADHTPVELRGAAFGLRQSLDTVGAFVGPLLAIGLMIVFHNNFRAVFWFAVIPAVLSVLLLWRGVTESNSVSGVRQSNPLRRESMAQLSSAYWWVVVMGSVFTLARFSEAFLVLRAAQLGVAIAWVPLVMVAMNVIYAISALPFGHLSDRVSHRSLLTVGVIVLGVADIVLGHAKSITMLMIGVLLWGLHMGMTQGLLSAMVAHTAPATLRGTAFGLFNLACGIAMLLASVIAGLMWDAYGAAMTFYCGGVFCALSLLLLKFGHTNAAKTATVA